MPLTYYDRNGTKVESPRNFQVSDNASRVLGISDVVDVILIGNLGQVYSVSPESFSSLVVAGNETNTAASYAPYCDESSVTPLASTWIDRYNATMLVGHTTPSGAWHNNSSDAKRAFLDTLSESDFAYSKLTNSKNNNIQANWKCTEFYLLYHNIGVINAAMSWGYQMFSPSNYNDKNNWLRFPSSKSQNNYCFIMYLTKQRHILENSCLNPPDSGFSSQCVTWLKSDSGNVATMATESCVDSSTTTRWSTLTSHSTLYPGQALYSANSKFKLLMQVDGNLVIYNLKNLQAIWSSDTYGIEKYFSFFAIQADGNLVIYNKSGSPVWASNTSGGNVKLVMDNTGVAFLYNTNNLNSPIWSSAAGTRTIDGAFAKHCANGQLSTINDNLVSSAKADFCKKGDNMWKDSRCGIFNPAQIPGDTNLSIKTSIDNHVMNNLCNYNTMDKNNTELVNFCSCVTPVGSAKIMWEDKKLNPKCWDGRCSNSGYKSISFADTPCPSSICIQDISMKNLLEASNIKIECTSSSTSNNTSTNPSSTTTSTNTSSTTNNSSTNPSSTTTSTNASSTTNSSTPPSNPGTSTTLHTELNNNSLGINAQNQAAWKDEYNWIILACAMCLVFAYMGYKFFTRKRTSSFTPVPHLDQPQIQSNNPPTDQLSFGQPQPEYPPQQPEYPPQQPEYPPQQQPPQQQVQQPVYPPQQPMYPPQQPMYPPQQPMYPPQQQPPQPMYPPQQPMSPPQQQVQQPVYPPQLQSPPTII